MLSALEQANLSDYEAIEHGLPRHVEAVMILNVEGRPESEHFNINYSFRPAAHARPWAYHEIDGIMLKVGGNHYRLNLWQYQAVQLVARFGEAQSLAERIALWPELVRLTHAPRSARLEASGYLVNLNIQESIHARISITDDTILPIPLLPMQRLLTHGFIKYEGRLMGWAECYQNGYIPEVLQTKRRTYVRLSPELVEALTFLHQALGESDIRSAIKAYEASQRVLPTSHRHLILPA